eukprot:RCo049290
MSSNSGQAQGSEEADPAQRVLTRFCAEVPHVLQWVCGESNPSFGAAGRRRRVAPQDLPDVRRAVPPADTVKSFADLCLNQLAGAGVSSASPSFSRPAPSDCSALPATSGGPSDLSAGLHPLLRLCSRPASGPSSLSAKLAELARSLPEGLPPVGSSHVESGPRVDSAQAPQRHTTEEDVRTPVAMQPELPSIAGPPAEPSAQLSVHSALSYTYAVYPGLPPSGLSQCTAVAMPGGAGGGTGASPGTLSVLIFGGLSSSRGSLPELNRHMYRHRPGAGDPGNVWERVLPRVPQLGRYGHSAVSYQGTMLVFGGFGIHRPPSAPSTVARKATVPEKGQRVKALAREWAQRSAFCLLEAKPIEPTALAHPSPT